MPIVPIIKSGPELLVKLSSLSHSSLDKISFSLKSQAILAPSRITAYNSHNKSK